MNHSNKTSNPVVNSTLRSSIDVITTPPTPMLVPDVVNEETPMSLCMTGRQKHFENIHPVTTRQKALAMTRNAVLNTTELMEAIILDVTPGDVLRCRLVIHIWNNIVTHSPRLRVELSLDVEKGSGPLGDQRVFDNNATHIWQSLFVADVWNHRGRWQKRERFVHPCVLNPLIFRRETRIPTSQKSSKREAQRCESVYFLRRSDVAKLSRPRDLGGSIMGDMFVCQPSVTEVEVEFHYQKVVLRSMTDWRMCLRWQARKRLRLVNHWGTRVGNITRKFVDIMEGISEDFKLSVFVESCQRRKNVIRMSGASLISL
jgi:hypothetical protein